MSRQDSSGSMVRRLAAKPALNQAGGRLACAGGITPDNAHLVIEAGANALVAGSAVFGSKVSCIAQAQPEGMAAAYCY